MRVNPFIPDGEFLERRTREFVDRERARQDRQWGGWEHDRSHDAVIWLALVDKQRGQAAALLVAGGRFGAFDRKAMVRQLIQISALARRAAAVVMADVYEAEGEHVDDGFRELFEDSRNVAAASPLAPEEIPF